MVRLFPLQHGDRPRVRQLYFPESDPGRHPAFLIYAVGFIARPIGAAIFGHYGDRIGRKATLVATLLLMGLATFAVAFVPSYARIGIWGAVLLTLLRFVQGVGVGGEWGGSVLMSMEWAHRRASRPGGLLAAVRRAGRAVPGQPRRAGREPAERRRFPGLGWRIPFLLSIVLVAIGLYIRLNILETPVFARLLAEHRIEKAPMLQVIRRQPGDILLSALVRMAEQAPFYIFTAFVFTYGVMTLGMSRDLLLTAVLAAAVLEFFTIPFFGHLSDLLGRRRMYIAGALAVGVFGFLYFAMVDTRNPAWVFAAIVLSLVPHAMMYGPQAALIAETFTGRLRATAVRRWATSSPR